MMLDTIKTHIFLSFRRNIMTEKSHKAEGDSSHALGITVRTQRGNAMVYVLIALALFGFLTATLSRSNNQADEQDIDDEQAEFYALELIEYAASAQIIVDQMLFSGSEVDELDFVMPTDPAFNTPPHHHKVYHPQGGGLSYQFELPEALQVTVNAGWYVVRNNVEWTNSSGNDIILTAIRIPQKICEIINKKITGNMNIPQTDDFLSTYFTNPIKNLDSTECLDCLGYTNLCVVTPGSPGNHGYYNIIAAQ